MVRSRSRPRPSDKRIDPSEILERRVEMLERYTDNLQRTLDMMIRMHIPSGASGCAMPLHESGAYALGNGVRSFDGEGACSEVKTTILSGGGSSEDVAKCRGHAKVNDPACPMLRLGTIN